MSPPMARQECRDISTELMGLIAPQMLKFGDDGGALWHALRKCSPDEIDVAFRWVGMALSNVVHKEGPNDNSHS